MLRPKISLLLSINDHEAEAIAGVAAATKGVQLIELGLGWGGPVAKALAGIDIGRLAPTVILVECPCPAFERAVEQSGRTLHIVDHHLWLTGDGQIVDRRSPRSSLEQVVRLLGSAESDDATRENEHRLIAANDSGFWRGLFAELSNGGGDVVAEIKKRRLLDIAAVLRGQESNPRRRHDKLSTFIARAEEAFDQAEKAYAQALAEGKAVIARPLGRRHAIDQPVFVLVEAEDETRFLADAIYHHHLQTAQAALAGNPLRPEHCDVQLCIVRFEGTKEKRRPVELFLSAGADLGDSIAPLVEVLRTHPAATGATIYAGAGPMAAFLGVTADGDISALVDIIVGDRLKGERPLAAWSSQFFQIVRADTESWYCPSDDQLKSSDWERLRPSDQTRGYFLPAIRERLAAASPAMAGRADPAHRFDIRSYELRGLDAVFHISREHNDKSSLTSVRVNRLRMHILEAQRMIAIEWIIGGLPGDANKSLWQSMFQAHSNRDDNAIITIADLLDCNEAVRLVNSNFKNRDKRWISRLCISEGSDEHKTSLIAGYEALPHGKMPTRVTVHKALLKAGYAANARLDKPDGWFAVLAARALTPLKLHTDKVTLQFDPRARSVHAMIPCGARPVTAAGIAREDALLSRLVGVDSYADGGPPYDPAFNDEELKQWRYRRYAAWGTHYAASGYSFAAYAYGDFGFHHLTETKWFNREPCEDHYFATGHVQSMYWIMFLITMLHNAVFDALANDHARAVQARLRAVRWGNRKDEAAAIEDIRQLRRQLTDYLASLWFTDVSPELQGQDLYRLMLERSGAKARFERLHDAFVDADAVEVDREQRREELRRGRIETVALAFGAPIVAVTLVMPIIDIWMSPLLGTAKPAAKGAGLMLSLDDRSGVLDWPVVAAVVRHIGETGAYLLALALTATIALLGRWLVRQLGKR